MKGILNNILEENKDIVDDIENVRMKPYKFVESIDSHGYNNNVNVFNPLKGKYRNL